MKENLDVRLRLLWYLYPKTLGLWHDFMKTFQLIRSNIRKSTHREKYIVKVLPGYNNQTEVQFWFNRNMRPLTQNNHQ